MHVKYSGRISYKKWSWDMKEMEINGKALDLWAFDVLSCLFSGE